LHTTERLNPLLRWAGSKRQIVPVLAEYWRLGFARYVEPFAGSAVLFAHLHPKRALLGDLNKHLISTYRAVRDDAAGVSRTLQSFKKGSIAYAAIRTAYNLERDRTLRAAQFIYLNRFCFNGLYRTNLMGEFNVPFGADKTGTLPTLEQLSKWARLLRKTTLHAGDFEALLGRTTIGDFVYMDPPFAVKSRRVFRQYDPSTFSEDDIHRLKRCMKVMDRKGVKFVVSYAESTEAADLAKGFNVRRVFVRRHIAGFTSSRRRAAEYLISN
jgi:DNA adenine methylase